MSIEQTIVDSVEISKYTKIPVLFISNPGLGKTTILKRYANRYGYHLETLIGSRFTPEEISGYQVNNGGDHLTHMNPEWFNRILIKKQEKKRTLLFIDELSTCSEFVQGALLSLIFDRTIGNGKMLPDDCIIISAANYSGNLPSTMNLMAPTLNRFIIINLNDNYNAIDMLQEFLNPPKPAIYPQKIIPPTLTEKAMFFKKFQDIWKEIFIMYSDSSSTLGHLDIGNRDLNGLYTESQDSVYNFISGRTISYLSRTLLCVKTLGIQSENSIIKMIDGLVGAGSCLFKDKLQGEKFRQCVHEKMLKDLLKFSNSESVFIPLVNDLQKDVESFITNLENTSFSREDAESQIITLSKEILETFRPEIVFSSKNSYTTAKFVSDFEASLLLLRKIFNLNLLPAATVTVYSVLADFYGYYCEVTNSKIDYQGVFGSTSRYYSRVIFIKKNNNTFARAAVCKGKYSYKLIEMKINENFFALALNNNKGIQSYEGKVVFFNTKNKQFCLREINQFL